MMTFPPATLADAAALIAVQDQSFLSDFQHYGICPSYAQPLERMERHIREDFVFRVELDGRLIGDMVVMEKAPGHYHLQCICIIPGEEGRGFGSAALAFLWGRFPDAVLWTLVTPADKKRNHAFYQRHGFVVYDTFQTEHVSMVCFQKESPSHEASGNAEAP